MNKLIAIASITVALVGCGGGGSSATTPTTHVVALMGQSNMVGVFTATDAPYTPSPSIKHLTLDNRLVESNGQLYSTPSNYTELFTTTSEGPGMAFAEELLSRLPAGDSIVLVPCARGGSSMAEQTLDNTTNIFNMHFPRSLLDVCQERIALALELSKGTFDGTVYYQGESDAHLPSIDDYGYWGDGLSLIRETLADQFGSNNLVTMQIANFLGRTPEQDAQWDAFKQYQTIWAVENDVQIVYTDDQPMGDVIHLSIEGAREVGKRAASVF